MPSASRTEELQNCRPDPILFDYFDPNSFLNKNMTARCFSKTTGCPEKTTSCHQKTIACPEKTTGCKRKTTGCHRKTTACRGKTDACTGKTKPCKQKTNPCPPFTKPCKQKTRPRKPFTKPCPSIKQAFPPRSVIYSLFAAPCSLFYSRFQGQVFARNFSGATP